MSALRTMIAPVSSGMLEFGLITSFEDEEVASSYGYLSGYDTPVGINRQVNCLQRTFPGIGCANEEFVNQLLPENAEGYFAIPRWQLIASTYNEAVRRVLEALKRVRGGKFCLYPESVFTDEIAQEAATSSVFHMLEKLQAGYDILVVPAQFGLRHRGRSGRRAREVYARNEFGLGVFAIGIMLLTHESRLQSPNDLGIDLVGDEQIPGAVASLSMDPDSGFIDNELRLSNRFVGEASEFQGAATGFF